MHENQLVTPERKALVLGTWREVLRNPERAAARLSARLFWLDSEIRDLFDRAAARRGRLAERFTEMLEALDDPRHLDRLAAQLGREHAAAGLRERHYRTIAAALLWTLEHELGPVFTTAAREAWSECCHRIVAALQRVALRAGGEPAPG